MLTTWCWLWLWISLVTLESTGDLNAAAADGEAVGKCRDREGMWQPQQFQRRACARCYQYLFRGQKELQSMRGQWLVSLNGRLYRNLTMLVPDVQNATARALVCGTLSWSECQRWTACCSDANQCCDHMLLHAHAKNNSQVEQCPATWDGYGCWPLTPPSTNITERCPAYIHHNTKPGGRASKQCLADGTWQRDAQSQLEWSNYTDCVHTHIQRFRLKMYLGLSASGVSVLFLLPACAIFLAYRPLRCQQRIQLHLQLFFSFIASCASHIVWELSIVLNVLTSGSAASLLHQNTIGCKLLFMVTRYTRTTNYMWMFCEAFYLHKLITRAFQPPADLFFFYILGWGLPLVPISVYSVVKHSTDDTRCWINNMGGWEWLIYLPNLLSMAVNLVLLINILRILVSQLQSHPNEPSNYRRAFKATAVLVPLFGLQLILIIYRPPLGSNSANVYEHASALITHSQGFFVALIFCFMNGEVHSHLSKSSVKVCFRNGGGGGGGGRAGSGTLATQISDSAASINDHNRIDKRNYIPMLAYKTSTEKT